MKLKTRIMYLNLGIMMLITMGVVSYLLVESYTSTEKMAMENAEKKTIIVASEIENILDDALNDTKSLGTEIELMKVSGEGRRDDVNLLLKNVLERNIKYEFSWASFEPDAFDQSDAANGNMLGSNSEGRFLPTCTRNEGELIFETLQDIEEQDFYRVPKETMNFYITEPITYTLKGKEQTIVVFCEPIVVKYRFVGVAGIGISLDTLRDINNEAKFYESGFGQLINHKGIVLAHPNEELLNQIGEEFQTEDGEMILDDIKEGKSFMFSSKSIDTGEDVYKIYAPIHFKDYNFKWSYSSTIVNSEMMAEKRSLIILMSICSLVGIVFMAIVTYKNSLYVVNSVKTIS